MAEFAPEYQSYLDNALAQISKRKSAANAAAQTEAARRGFINPTGTSDIEMGLRRSAAEPYAQAETSTISDVMKDWYDKKREERMIGEGRTYQTGEREAAQKWQTGERGGAQNWQAQMAGYYDPATGVWSGNAMQERAGESQKQRDWEASQNALNRANQDYWMQQQRNWANEDASGQKSDWWKNALGGALGTTGGIVGGGYIGKKMKLW